MSNTSILITMVLLVLICGISFIVSIIRDRRSFINGFLLMLFILSFLLTLILFGNSNYFLGIVGIVGLILIIGFYSSFLWWLLPLLLFNGIKLRKLEGKKFTNSLTLILLASIIVFIISTNIVSNQNGIREFDIISVGLSSIYFYFLIHVIIFINTYFLQKLPLLKKPDFIIILGSGLVKDKVPPLLASRIDKGLTLYNKYRTEKDVKIIFSGGQGKDENIPEGKAMADYARNKGVPNTDIIEEIKSKTTYENLLYSKEKMDNISNEYNSVLVTNNFHVLRAVLLAKKMEIKIYGIGSETKFYFWINAFIREYIAILSLNKKRHIIILFSLATITILCIFISLIERFLT